MNPIEDSFPWWTDEMSRCLPTERHWDSPSQGENCRRFDGKTQRNNRNTICIAYRFMYCIEYCVIAPNNEAWMSSGWSVR